MVTRTLLVVSSEEVWMDGVTHAMQVHAMMLTHVSRLGSGPQDHEEGCVIHPVTHASSLTRF